MHRDTRRLTVSREHLAAAYEEITRAQGQPEPADAASAARRALDHLSLVYSRLEQEPALRQRDETGRSVHLAYDRAHEAWQWTHTALNEWPQHHVERLKKIRAAVIDASEALDRALAPGSE